MDCLTLAFLATVLGIQSCFLKRRAVSPGVGVTAWNPWPIIRAMKAPRSFLGSDKSLDLYVGIHNLFTFYINMMCFYVPAGDYLKWNILFNASFLHIPYHYEGLFGKLGDRDEYNRIHFNLVRRVKKDVLGSHMGFHEIFTPVFSDDTCLGFLVMGPFSRAPLTAGQISRLWTRLSGKQASPQDPDFLPFARMALDIQVLDDKALKGCRELLGLIARCLSGRANGSMFGQVERLRKGVISHHLPHIDWMDRSLRLEKFDVPGQGRVLPWEKEELGITRYPSVILAMAHPGGAQEKLTILETMAREKRLQWEALKIAREFPETVVGWLEDYGVIFAVSVTPGKSPVQAKLDIKDRAEAIRRGLEKRTGATVLVGIGNFQSPGSRMESSRRQAVLALNFCNSLGGKVVFYSDHPVQESLQWNRGLWPALQRLTRAHLRESMLERDTARSEFIQQALTYSNERGENLRAHLMHALSHLSEALRGRLPSENKLEVLVDSLEEKLRGARTIQDMLVHFREGLEILGGIGIRPSSGKHLVGMEATKAFVDAHFTEPLRMGNLAAKSGLSIPTFLKEFRKKTGQGFSRYVQGLRLEESKRMLRSSPLSVARVAQECGFNSASYFTRNFKKLTGSSPQKYRKNAFP